jgi:hypothetical protein
MAAEDGNGLSALLAISASSLLINIRSVPLQIILIL